MEILPLSKRGFTVFKRYVEMTFDEVLERAKKAKRKNEDYNSPYAIKVGNWRIVVDYHLGFHEDNCDDDDGDGDRILFDGKCDTCEYEKVQIEIEAYYTYNPDKNDLRITSLYTDADVATKEHLYEFLDKVKETQWAMCPCKSVAKKDGLCNECYIHSYERTEEEGGNCAICYENNGRWVKMECGHIFHKHCVSEIERDRSTYWNVKCPLCRKVSNLAYDNKKVIQDCYDV